ncbi:MAG: hypothetical protein QW379_09990 [Thermoplasmata archaeon]
MAEAKEESGVNGMGKGEWGAILAGVVLFGSVWGMLECVLGALKIPGPLSIVPMGAVLAGFFGLGLMALSRRIYGIPMMQLAIGVVAGFIRLWAPIGTCVICSALAIVAEGMVFELIFNRPLFNIAKNSSSPLLDTNSLALVGALSGYAIYVTGYLFTQFFTPIVAPPHEFNPSSFVAVLPLIFGRGFFAAITGAAALPLAIKAASAPLLQMDMLTIRKKLYYPVAMTISALCWGMVIVFV